jgi:CRISPR-associated protein Cas1
MKQNFYLISDGKLKREENTIYFVNEDGKRALPISRIYSIYALGSLSLTSKAISLLAKEGICIHFFNRNGFYIGSFYPRETLVSGDLLVKQVEHYLDGEKRIFLAKAFVEGSILNMNRVLSSYKSETDLVSYLQSLAEVESVEGAMGVEAIAKTEYFSNFDGILKNFKFGKRSRQPPKNEVNAMMSFGNALLYSAVLSEIYHTQLHPAVSYLHEPSERRFSLSLDISEIFKPIIVDRMIFYLVNKGIMKEGDFDKELEGVLLSESGKRKIIEEFNSRLKTTVKHRQLKRNVSYQRLIRLECYKLIKHLLGSKQYKPLVMWW